MGKHKKAKKEQSQNDPYAQLEDPIDVDDFEYAVPLVMKKGRTVNYDQPIMQYPITSRQKKIQIDLSS